LAEVPMLCPGRRSRAQNHAYQPPALPLSCAVYSASNQRLPCLYICPMANVLGRAPLIPCFIRGNSHPTIPHSFDRRTIGRSGSASADTQRERGNGSRPWTSGCCASAPHLNVALIFSAKPRRSATDSFIIFCCLFMVDDLYLCDDFQKQRKPNQQYESGIPKSTKQQYNIKGSGSDR
jgi:hypothetical protein